MTVSGLGTQTYIFHPVNKMVWIDTPNTEALEGGAARPINIHRGGSSGALVVTVEVSGFATPGLDHNLNSTTVTFNNGETLKTLNLIAANDNIAEGWESVVVSLGATD